MPSPNRGTTVDNELYGVDGISPTDVWAVGQTRGGASETLIEHWDGTKWTVVGSPNPGSQPELWGVSALSGSNAWAVGYDFEPVLPNRTLIEHWHGGRWKVVPSPNVGSRNSQLYAVDAISSRNVWAVGNSVASGSQDGRTLIEHWHHREWRVVSSPDARANVRLTSVSAVGPRDVWAVGVAETPSGFQTFTEHWDGNAWTIVPSPSVGTNGSFLYGVQARNATAAFAVGSYEDASFVQRALVLRWNGTAWQRVTSAPASPAYSNLNAVSAMPGTSVWTVGFANTNTLVEEGRFGAWTQPSSPSPVGAADAGLYGALVLAQDDVWAVGLYRDSSFRHHTLIEHYC